MEKQHRGEGVSKQPLKRRTIIRELLFRILEEELALFPELFMAILEVEKGFGIPLGKCDKKPTRPRQGKATEISLIARKEWNSMDPISRMVANSAR
jgi:hypothetical protein